MPLLITSQVEKHRYQVDIIHFPFGSGYASLGYQIRHSHYNHKYILFHCINPVNPVNPVQKTEPLILCYYPGGIDIAIILNAI